VKMRRCEDEKMFYRPPLLEEPCAQTLSGIKIHVNIHFLAILACLGLSKNMVPQNLVVGSCTPYFPGKSAFPDM